MENASTAPGSSSDSWTASGDALHRTLASSADPRCWLVIDPTVRQLDPDEPLAQALSDANAAPLPVPSPHPAVDASVMPSLTQLDSSTAAGSAAITASVADAHAECEPDALTHGSGRRIGGWLEAAVSGAVLGQHIASQMVQRRPDGRTTLLRWTDPAVLWAMWPVLGAQQQSTLLGPISRYQLLDPAGRLVSMSPPGTLSSALPGIPELPSLGLSESQWMELDAIGALNQALQEVQPARLAAEALAAARDAGLAAAVRARELGFETQGDVAHFAEKAITVAPNFDTHPLIEQRLAQRDPDDYFKALVEDLDEKNWARIGEESKATPPPAEQSPEKLSELAAEKSAESDKSQSAASQTAKAPPPNAPAAPAPAPAPPPPPPPPPSRKAARKTTAKKKSPTKKVGSISACEQCTSSGLPIMLVRYAVVPTNVEPGLPAWTEGDRVKSVNVGPEFKYALRTMREGYVYLFYAAHARGANHWECYTVGEDGCMKLQPSPQAATPQIAPWFQCVREGHNNIRMHYIVIDQPHKCGPTWIAFSQHKWSDLTLGEYTKNTQLRNKRMQTLHPSKMAEGAKHSHGAIASREVIESVIEYAPGFDQSKLPDGSVAVPTLTRPDGSLVDPSVVKRVSTRYPLHLRKGDAQVTADNMKERGLQADGLRSSAHVVALWDAIGATHELNGFRNDAAAWTQRYDNERDFEIDAVVSYDGLEELLRGNAEKLQEARQNVQHKHGMIWYDAEDIAQRRASAAKLPEPQRSRQLETCDILDDWGQRGVSNVGGFQLRLAHANYLDDAGRAAEINLLMAEVERSLATREAIAENNVKEAGEKYGAGGWPKYRDRIVRESAVRAPVPSSAATSAQRGPVGRYRQPASGGADAFRRNKKAFENSVNALINQRTPALLQWLEAPLLIDTLNDFHGESVYDGLLFGDTVAEAVQGLGSCKKGAEKIREWVEECSAMIERNLLWRAVALNQFASRVELSQALKEAKDFKENQLAANALQWVGYTNKSLKAFAETYKKVQGIVDFNNVSKHIAELKDGRIVKRTDAPGVYFGVKLKVVEVDKLLLTVGKAVFGFFRIDKLGEFASEKIIQHAFNLRALVNAIDSEKLIAKEASANGLSRSELLKELRASRLEKARRAPKFKVNPRDDIRKAYEDLKVSDHEGQAFRGRRDGALAAVVMLIELTNFLKLMADCEIRRDSKSYLTLLASGVTITSLLLEIVAYSVRDLTSSRTVTFQAMKGIGGVLSCGAILIGAWTDLADSKKSAEAGYHTLAFLQMAKVAAGAANFAVTAATAYTHAAGLIARLTGTAVDASWMAVKLGSKAAAFVELRIAIMFAGAWVTPLSFGLTFLVWIETPDALEVWIDHSAFGAKRWDGGYTSAKEQRLRLKDALVNIGVPQETPLPQ